jgi:hypothetical protein
VFLFCGLLFAYPCQAAGTTSGRGTSRERKCDVSEVIAVASHQDCSCKPGAENTVRIVSWRCSDYTSAEPKSQSSWNCQKGKTAVEVPRLSPAGSAATTGREQRTDDRSPRAMAAPSNGLRLGLPTALWCQTRTSGSDPSYRDRSAVLGRGAFGIKVERAGSSIVRNSVSESSFKGQITALVR